MAALLGREVLTKDYETVRIQFAFHPQVERFEVATSRPRSSRKSLRKIRSHASRRECLPSSIRRTSIVLQ